MNHARTTRNHSRRQVLASAGAACLLHSVARGASTNLRLGVPPGPLTAWIQAHLSGITRRTGATVELVSMPEPSGALKNVDVALVPPADLGRVAGDLLPVPNALTSPASEIAWGNLIQVWRDRLARWEGKTFGLPVHGDLRVLLCRNDLFDDAGRNRRFEAKFGRAIRAPLTWRETADLIEFWSVETGRPAWTPTPLSPEERRRGFYEIATSHVVERLSASDRARSERLDEQARFGMEFDLDSGRCLLGSTGFVRAAELLARLQKRSAAKPEAEPWRAMLRGEVPMAVAPVAAIRALQQRRATRDRFTIHTVPGADTVFSSRGGPSGEYPQGNFVPYLGLSGALACVSTSANDPSRAWAVAAVIASPPMSQDAVLDSGLGGPVREQQLESGPWDGLELDRERLDQFRAVLRRTLLPLDCINPALVLRLPDNVGLNQQLVQGLDAISSGAKPPAAAMAEIASAWNAARADRPKARQEVRANIGLS